ncbi:MAG: YjgN family protein [Moraxellaceae bacterium]|nr:YjgN family protein [Moraxellaceae bacterium]
MLNQEASPAHQQLQEQEYRFRFTGSGGEYFSIWIVNLLLSIITLGIYSAWAKVRREQYFHRNTLLDDQPFDYTGDPVRILIGRIVALLVIGVGSAVQEVNLVMALAVTAVFFLLFPWVIVRSMRFRARNTRYRNLSFAFTGTTFEALKAYFWIYVALLPFIAASILMTPELKLIQENPELAKAPETTNLMLKLGVALGVSVLLGALLFPAYQCHVRSFLHRHLRYGNAQGTFDGTTSAFYGALFRTFGVSLLTLVLIGVVGFAAKLAEQPWLLVLAYPVLFLPQAAYTVNMTNVTYRHAGIGNNGFVSDMKVGAMAWLLFTNLLLLMVTLGLAWPWIKVRLTRYRLAHMSLLMVPGTVDAIIGEAQNNPSAFGEEAAEFLDFDISL